MHLLYSDEIKPDPSIHLSIYPHTRTHSSLGFLPARRGELKTKTLLLTLDQALPLAPRPPPPSTYLPLSPSHPHHNPQMSLVPATGKRQRDAESDGDDPEDQLPESGAYVSCVLNPARPPCPPQHRPGSARPPQSSQPHPADPLLSLHVESKSAPTKKRGRPPKRKPEPASAETAAAPPVDPAAPAPAAPVDALAAAVGTSAGDAPAPPPKRGRGRPRKVSSAPPNRVTPSSAPSSC